METFHDVLGVHNRIDILFVAKKGHGTKRHNELMIANGSSSDMLRERR